MKKISALSLLLLVILSTPMFAQLDSSKSPEPVVVEKAPAPHKIEGWYLYAAMGAGVPLYSGSVQSAIREIGTPIDSTSELLYDQHVGIYLPAGKHLLIGAVLNITADNFSVVTNGPEAYYSPIKPLSITQATLGVSGMHFFERTGKGLFVRGDIGLAAVNLHDGGTNRSTGGFGALVGGGYALPLSNEYRVMLNANYAARFVDSGYHSALGVTAGILF